MIDKLRKELKKLSNPQKAKVLQGFFKTGKGEYGEGDIFLGLTVPQSRKIAIKYKEISFDEIKKLLQSKIHEERLIALLILVHRFEKGTDADKNKVYNYYLKNTKYINNWDLVDLSADKIVGHYLLDKSKNVLFKLARSKNLWERRISIVATYQFIKDGRYQETLTISKMLLNDTHDLIHKAVGWMLREVGKQSSQEILEDFLKKHYKQMPRTMLRYAIERLPEKLRKMYLSRE
ncbi:MAG: DNA alkylation repair protein [Candidatus Levybacteria bacterium RIFCSPHIGHO2_02_FULL_37_13]|nr:MAG: DNA alkylation repair protein [Candidatus Levybacteria bacterium RIFCSPHIGHO2_02_FULL_37_13]OGH40392.1 MAG: DNA alkylation repair protein [Candidatus Levybacteria bacterium RIFCSPLOWO2_01_FULL_37_26]